MTVQGTAGLQRWDCHCHLEGSIFPRALRRIRRLINVPLERLGVVIPDSLPSGFHDFIHQFRGSYPLFRFPDTYGIVLEELLLLLADEKVAYTEVHVNLALMEAHGHNPEDIFRRLWQVRETVGMEAGVDCRFIADVPWQFSPSLLSPLLREANAFQSIGVLGVSLGGDESLAEPSRFTYALEQCRSLEFKILCHCGELPGQAVVRAVLDQLPVQRLVHALSAASSPALLRQIHDRGISIDVCFTSNRVLLGVEFEEHPWRLFRQHEIPIAFGSDDPAIFHITPGGELDLAASLLGDAANRLFWEESRRKIGLADVTSREDYPRRSQT